MANSIIYEIGAKDAGFISTMEKQARQVARFEDSLERLTGGQITYNAAAKRFIDASGQFVSRARVKEIALQQLAKAQQLAAAATDQTTRANTQAAGAIVRTATVQTALVGRTQRSGLALTQLSYAVNDLQAGLMGGLRGAIIAVSNNLQQMSILMGASGGVVFLLSAAATAAATLAPAIEDAFFRGRKEAERAKEAYADALGAVIEFERARGVLIPDAALPGAIRTQRGIIEQARSGRAVLEEALATANVNIQRAQEQGVTQERFRALQDEARAIRDNIALLDKTIEQDEELLTLLEKRQAARAAELRLQARGIELGGRFSDEERLADEAARKLNDALRRRIALLQLEGKQIAEIAKHINRGVRPLATISVVPRQTNALGREEYAPIGSGQLRQMSEGTAAEMEALGAVFDQEGRAVISKAVAWQAELSYAMAELGPAIAGGLANAAVGVLTGRATFMQAMGGFIQDLGQGLIAAGTAGIAIKAFISNPFAAIAAGVALTVLGAQLARSSQARADSFASSTPGLGSGGYGGTGYYYGTNYTSAYQQANDGRLPTGLPSMAYAPPARPLEVRVQADATFSRAAFRQAGRANRFMSELTSVRSLS